jgi:DUF2075 family protein
MANIHTIKYDPSQYNLLRKIEFTLNWPTVYLLEDSKEIYIGQSGNLVGRLKQHNKNPTRNKLKKAHIITDREYNLSATLDIESLLIQYIAADEKFLLQNSNAGLLNHNYYDRVKYLSKFEELWQELQKKNITVNDLVQLRNTDLFKYSPYKSLTEEQLNIVSRIKNSIDTGLNLTYIINGEPGTGKSVLGTYLVKYLLENLENDKKLSIALVIPMTSLRRTLKKVFSKIKGLNSRMVIGPTEIVGNNFDVLIVDEAHRLRRRVNLSGYKPFDDANEYYGLGKSGNQLDWIMRASKSQILLYDKGQSVTPGDIRVEHFTNLPAVHFDLTSQLRVLAGNDYMEFIDNVLSSREVTKPDFGEYEIEYFEYLEPMINKIKAKDKKHGLARLVAGYAWTWKTKNKYSQDYDIEIDGLKLKWNSENIDWVNSKNAINEVGCIHTVQGYDLNYVGVIIGPELGYDPITHKLIVYKDKYKDINGKRTLKTPEELEFYIINIYKTLLARGIKGTYIHAVDANLSNFLKNILF